MKFGKNKKEVSAEPATKGPTPYEIGLNGSVEDLYQADVAAMIVIAVKKTDYEAYAKKSDYGDSLFHSVNKYLVKHDAYNDAQEVPYQIHQELKRGAYQSFLDGNPENLQEILSHSESFRGSQYQSADDLVKTTLVALINQVANPGVPALALAKVDEGKKQDILNETLYAVVSGGYSNIEGSVSTLLKAGADAGFQSSVTLAMALHQDAPAGVINMLVENGANFDAALETMRGNREYYGDTPDKLAAHKYKSETDARIRELEETVKELTAKRKKELSASPAPAKKAAPPKYQHLTKLSTGS